MRATRCAPSSPTWATCSRFPHSNPVDETPRACRGCERQYDGQQPTVEEQPDEHASTSAESAGASDPPPAPVLQPEPGLASGLGERLDCPPALEQPLHGAVAGGGLQAEDQLR